MYNYLVYVYAFKISDLSNRECGERRELLTQVAFALVRIPTETLVMNGEVSSFQFLPNGTSPFYIHMKSLQLDPGESMAD